MVGVDMAVARPIEDKQVEEVLALFVPGTLPREGHARVMLLVGTRGIPFRLASSHDHHFVE